MANRARGELTIELDGAERTWCLRWKDIADIESALKQLRAKRVTWQEFCRDFASWGIEDYALVLWGGLRHEMKEITVQQIMEMATGITFQQFVLEFAELLNESIPERLKKKYQLEAATVEAETAASKP